MIEGHPSTSPLGAIPSYFPIPLITSLSGIPLLVNLSPQHTNIFSNVIIKHTRKKTVKITAK